MPFTEANYENAVIEIFRDTLGYAHVYGPDVSRDYSDPLYSGELLPALRRINPIFLRSELSCCFKSGNNHGGRRRKMQVVIDYEV